MQSCGRLVALARSTRASSKRRARNGATATTARRLPFCLRRLRLEHALVVERPDDRLPASGEVLLAVAVVAFGVLEGHLGDAGVALLLEDAGGADGQRA